MSDACGFQGKEIMFSSNDTPAEEFQFANELGAIINLDDFTHIQFLEDTMERFQKPSVADIILVEYLKSAIILWTTLEMPNMGLPQSRCFEGFRVFKGKGRQVFRNPCIFGKQYCDQ